MADRDRPYMQFNFLVNLGGNSDPGSVQAGFQEVTGLSTEIQQQDYRVGNSPHNNVQKLTALNKAADATFKRGIIKPKALFDWMNDVREGVPGSRRTITVELQSEEHKSVARWTLNEARPMKYSLGGLNAKGNDAAMEEFVIAYERLTVEELT
jgi:phage tail-like protein